MKYCFLVVFLFIIQAVTAQRSRLGIFFSPDVTYRTLTAKDAGAKSLVKGRNDREIPKWGFNTGISYEYRINRQLTFTTGLLFANKGFQTKQVMVTSIQPPPPPFYAFAIRYNYYVLGIPASISYYISLKKTRLFVNAGIEANYLLEANYIITDFYPGGREEKTEIKEDRKDYNILSMGVNAAFGIERDYKSFTFRLFPNIHYAVTNYFAMGNIIGNYPFSVGLGIGVYKTFIRPL